VPRVSHQFHQSHILFRYPTISQQPLKNRGLLPNAKMSSRYRLIRHERLYTYIHRRDPLFPNCFTMFDLILEVHHILISEGMLWEDNPEMINADNELAFVLGRTYVYLPELPKLLRPQIIRVSRPPPATSEDDDGTITAWLASMYNPRTSLQSLYNPRPLTCWSRSGPPFAVSYLSSTPIWWRKVCTFSLK
jgi:hypothetical protein